MKTRAAVSFRKATTADAEVLATLINMAGEGLPHYLWTGMAGSGQDPWTIGQSRACREEGGFSYRNSLIGEVDGAVAGCLIGYALPAEAQQTDYTDLPAMFVPLQELEDLAPNSWYINVVAVLAQFRGLGIGAALLARAEQVAIDARRPDTSLIVTDTNVGARRLYERCGYREIAHRPVVKEQWQTDAGNWVLMRRHCSG